ncbi:hypothetical protein THIOM_004600 [Candidatus Thiomargarita nelsonii]|uniref:Uncharacterized protein n=1 Tax=Candidatus Thiomargarita nelsonii TaxID=1003181 RepID=A0A176RVK3_9GAMM|nr:hypothetical protein THIOM_004600 [Candidatus Thiomargarita nelsonii]
MLWFTAALAGYRVDLLLGKKPFLRHWLKQIKPPKNSPYPPIKERVAVLQKYLQNIQKKLTFFDFGVRLSHFERCDDGEYFLREFQHIFPAREVLNNMGFCYLQRARQKMKSERAYFYWMPLVLDVETLAAILKTPSYFSISFKSLKQAAASGQGEGFLKEAMIYFKKAVEADQGYLPAQLNLAVTYLYLGKPHKARSVLEEAHSNAPDNLEIQALQALALYEQSEVDLDLWPRTVARLEKMAIKAQAPPALLYNLARLLEIRPRPGQARQYWNRLARMADSLPTPIRIHVCQQQSKQRQTMLAHLNRCPKCYHHWLETASYVQSFQPKKISFLKKLENFLTKAFQPALDNWKPLVSVTVTAVLVVAVLLYIIPPTKTPIAPIDASYIAVNTHNPDGFNQILENLPIETMTLGFDEVESSPAAQAFTAGIEYGQAVLTNTTPSPELTAYADTDEYKLGRWFVLLWTVAQTQQPMPIDFWTQQAAIGAELEMRFNKRPPDETTKTVLEVLTNLQPLLIELKTQPNNRRLIYLLSRDIEMAMNGISEL